MLWLKPVLAEAVVTVLRGVAFMIAIASRKVALVLANSSLHVAELAAVAIDVFNAARMRPDRANVVQADFVWSAGLTAAARGGGRGGGGRRGGRRRGGGGDL